MSEEQAASPDAGTTPASEETPAAAIHAEPETPPQGEGAPNGGQPDTNGAPPESQFGENGWYDPNWRDRLAGLAESDEDRERYANSAKKFTSIEDVFLDRMKLKSEMKDRNFAPLPHDGMSEEDKLRFHRQWGVPEGPDKYNYKLPEELEMDDYYANQYEDFRNLVYEEHLPQRTFERVMDRYVHMLQDDKRRVDEDARRYGRENDDKLRVEYGRDYGPKKELINRYLEESGVGPDYLQRQFYGGTTVSSDYESFKLLDNLATAYYGEGQVIDGENTEGADPEAKVREIMALYKEGLNDPEKMAEYQRREPEMDKWMKLSNARNKRK